MHTRHMELSPPGLAGPGRSLTLGTTTPGKPELLILQFCTLTAFQNDHQGEFLPGSYLTSSDPSSRRNSLEPAGHLGFGFLATPTAYQAETYLPGGHTLFILHSTPESPSLGLE